MEIEQEEKQGESAPPTAQNKPQEDYKVIDKEISDNEGTAENKASGDEEQSAKEDQISEDNASKSTNKGSDETSKNKFNRAIRRKFDFFHSMGLSVEVAEAKALQTTKLKKVKRAPVAPDGTSDPSLIPKKARSDEINVIKVCVVPDTFPEEKLTTEQSKEVQESIMDHILEMGTASTIKPKFHNSFVQSHGLTIICADQTTVDWLKVVAPTLRPWEGALLKALEYDEMPYPYTYMGFLPDSEFYSDEKVLKLLEAQNETFHVQAWKISKREVVDSEIKVTFNIDRKFTEELIKAGCKVNYKFGKVQLWPETKDTPPLPGDSSDTKFKSIPTFTSFRGGRAFRSNWRGVSRGRANWRGGPSNRGDGLQNRGGFGGSQSRGGFDGSQSRGSFEGSQSRGGFDSSQGRGGFVGSQSIGGFDGSQNRGGFDGSQNKSGFVGSQSGGLAGFVGLQSGGLAGFVGSQSGGGFVGSQSGSGYVGSQSGGGFVGSQSGGSSVGSQSGGGFVGSQSGGGFVGSQSGGGFVGSPSGGGFVVLPSGGGFVVSQSGGGFDGSQSSGGFVGPQSGGGFVGSQSGGGFDGTQSRGSYERGRFRGGFPSRAGKNHNNFSGNSSSGRGSMNWNNW